MDDCYQLPLSWLTSCIQTHLQGPVGWKEGLLSTWGIQVLLFFVAAAIQFNTLLHDQGSGWYTVRSKELGPEISRTYSVHYVTVAGWRFPFNKNVGICLFVIR